MLNINNNEKSENILELEDITKSFGGIHALQGITLNIKRGAIVGLIGPNGAGKTTLFNMISGFIPLDRGEIKFNKKSMNKLYPYERSTLGIGRTFQLPKIFTNMNVLENVVIGALQHSNDLNMCKDEALELLKKVDLDKFAELSPGELPIASRKKLEICRALATSPTLLLLDEAISGLTPKETLEMIDLIGKLSEMGLTVLIIEHVMKFIMNVSQWLIVLNHGQKIAEGTPEEISKNETVIDAYLGKKELQC
jgi:branched-chain amino acid transport system ATP-binding protein